MKKILKILTLVLMVLALTGCMKLNINVEVKADKSMVMNMDILAEEELFKSYGMSAEEYVDEMKESILSSEGMEDAKVTPLNKTIDGSQWVGVNVEVSGSGEMDASIKDVKIDGKDGIEITLPMDDLSNEMGTEDLSSLGYSVSQMKKLGVEMNMTIKMPGKVTSNVGTVDGDTVTIDLLELLMGEQSDDIVISSPLTSESGMGMMPVIIGVVVVVAVVAFIVFKKKKASTNELPYEEAPLTEPTSEGEETPVETTKSYCPNCGSELSDETTCPKCGFEIKK